MKRLALVTDAWRPQTNGVVNTLVRLVNHLESTEPRCSWSRPTHTARAAAVLPGDPGRVRSLEGDPAHARLQARCGSRGHRGAARLLELGWLRRKGLRFTTSFHTRYAEYLSARLPVPLEWGYKPVRWFHARAEHTLVSSLALLGELRGAAGGAPAGPLAARASTRASSPDAPPGRRLRRSAAAQSGCTWAAWRSRRASRIS